MKRHVHAFAAGCEAGNRTKTPGRLLGLCCLLLTALNAYADNINMLGAGKISCTAWQEQRANTEYFSAGNWLLGFMSGTAWDSGRNILSGRDPEKLFVFVDRYCDEHGKETISDAAVALAYHLLDTSKP